MSSRPINLICSHFSPFLGIHRPNFCFLLKKKCLRPMRTPSERSRARSLDDLSKSGDDVLKPVGSDNGLDKIDWQTPFTPVSLQSHWHSLAAPPPSSAFPHSLDMIHPPEDEVFVLFHLLIFFIFESFNDSLICARFCFNHRSVTCRLIWINHVPRGFKRKLLLKLA